MAPHEPPDRLGNYIENVHRKGPVGVADPGNVRHRQALKKAENKGDLAPLHPVDQTQGPEDSRGHPDPTVRGDQVDDDLQGQQNTDVGDFKFLPIGKELVVPPAVRGFLHFSTLSQVLSTILSNFILKYRPNREMAPGESS